MTKTDFIKDQVKNTPQISTTEICDNYKKQYGTELSSSTVNAILHSNKDYFMELGRNYRQQKKDWTEYFGVAKQLLTKHTHDEAIELLSNLKDCDFDEVIKALGFLKQ